MEGGRHPQGPGFKNHWCKLSSFLLREGEAARFAQGVTRKKESCDLRCNGEDGGGEGYESEMNNTETSNGEEMKDPVESSEEPDSILTDSIQSKDTVEKKE
ncbi:hypothetical protein NQZ68_022982 [Dissostichus eleginoides]|nr:hypothetical protein NQZ68_022982 [Dissostichus eleginoides]